MSYITHMINGIQIKKLNVIPDERGRLIEVLRCDEAFFNKFGQFYISTIKPGIVKFWHAHNIHEDNLVVVKGKIKIALFDDREDSPTYGQVDEYFAGDDSPVMLKIPPGVFHGFKCISEEEAIIVGISSEPYNRENPDTFRINPHNNKIPYNWNKKCKIKKN